MDFDIVRPNGNELELAQMAERLGFEKLVFLYEDPKQAASLKTLKLPGKIKACAGLLIQAINDLGPARQRADLVFAHTERTFFESRKIDYIICSPEDPSADLFYQRRSELDDASCALAHTNNIVLAFNAGIVHDSIALGRLSQNARLAGKHKVGFIMATFATKPMSMRAPRDLDALKRIL